MPATMNPALADNKREAVALLKKYLRSTEEQRTPILRRLAEVLVDAREHFTTADGNVDWKGRTHPYRVYVREVYDDARVPREDTATIQSAVRYHVGAVLRERLDAETLESLGMRTETPRERSVEQRANRSALLNALTAREIAGGALLALSAAYTVLSRLDADELRGLSEREREVADGTLRDLERRVKQLRKVVADA